jgi:hypothetical protein
MLPPVSQSTLELLDMQLQNARSFSPSERATIVADVLERLLLIAQEPSNLDTALQHLACHLGFVLAQAEAVEKEILLTNRLHQLAGVVDPKLTSALANLMANRK